MTEKQVVEYSITDAALAEMKEMYMPLVITDLDDKEQFDAVHSARMVVRGKRIEVEKKRVELKADALAWGKKVQSEANRIFALIEPIESHLMSEEKKAEIEKKRIEDERIAGVQEGLAWIRAWDANPYKQSVERIQEIIDALEKIEITPEKFFEFTADAFQLKEEGLSAARSAKQVRLNFDKEEADSKAEAERQAKVKIEQDRITAEQADAQAKIDKANRKIEAEKAAIAEAKRAEQVRKDREEFERKAKIKAEKDAKEAAQREMLEKIEHEKAEVVEIERKKSLLPDKEKLEAFSQFLLEGITWPKIKSPKAVDAITRARETIESVAENLFDRAQKL